MSDHNIEIVDRHGRRRRARKGETLQDGESFFMQMQFMDAEARELRDHLATKYAVHVVDSGDRRAGNKPGFLHDAALDRLQDAAAVAYEQRSAYLRNAWRTKDENGEPAHDTRTPDQAATDAYEQKKQRLADAWKTR